MLKLGTCVQWTSPVNGQSFRGIICGYPPEGYEVHHARQIYVMKEDEFTVLHGPCDSEIADLNARIKEQADMLTALKAAIGSICLPEQRPVEVLQQSDGTWWMDLNNCYASIDLDRGGYVGVDDAKSYSGTLSGSFHWGNLEELDVFLTLLLASRKTYIEKGVQRYRAETGL